MDNKKLFLVHNEDDVINPVRELISKIAEPLNNGGLIIFLNGELAAGKTVFVRTFAHYVGINRSIQSPTFTLMKSYDVDSEIIPELYKIVHIDAYRLEPHHKESLRVEEFLDEPGTIVFVEWPVAIDLDNSISFAHVNFEVVNEDLRKVEIIYTKAA